jgi:hypothetical protein
VDKYFVSVTCRATWPFTEHDNIRLFVGKENLAVGTVDARGEGESCPII